MSTDTAAALPLRLSDTRLAALVGGWRGALDGALPPIVFVATNALARTTQPATVALRWSVVAAGAVGLALVLVRLVRRETLKQALRGIVGLAVATAFASASGEARDFFRPGIWVDAAWAVAFAVSVLTGRPLVGVIHAWLFRTGTAWRRDRRLRRAFAALTFGWSAVYALRAGVGSLLYGADEAGLLALAKIALGWPLTIVGVMVTLAVLRRTAADGREPAGQAPA
ncbi:DUF3159 domain-containing protein [Oryzobacter sp. R7]|uniref:DUF3159 domain-containing protein n=1 Tax=Oryzobacter faecalis TaxID=3388656 RepID=UPI00398CC985